jgi:hypothetical protein
VTILFLTRSSDCRNPPLVNEVVLTRREKTLLKASHTNEYMRKRRAIQKLERERNEAVSAAMTRLSSPMPTAGLSIRDRLAKLDVTMADMRLLLAGVKAKYGVGEANKKGRTIAALSNPTEVWIFVASMGGGPVHT